MSIITGVIGSCGSAPKTATWNGIYFDPIQEGQQQTITVDFANWDNSTVYWTLVEAGSSASLNSRVVGGQANGTIYPGNGDSSQTINFTFSADATTEGTTYYVVRVGSTPGGNDYINNGNYTLRDSSQTPALVLDLDPANYNSSYPTVWPDTSGQSHPGGIYNYNTSDEAGGTFIFDGSTTQAEVTSLNNSTYGTVTLSAWIKPTAVTGSNQTIIAKELCHKLRINGDGTLTFSTAKGYSPWEVTGTIDAGVVTAGAWAQVVATVDADYTRMYVNGVEVTTTSGNVIGVNNSPFDIGMYQTTGSPSDFFGGLMGEVKVWNYAITGVDVINEYNTTAGRYGLNPISESLVFNAASHQYLGVSGSTSDWALGTSWTIEWWSKHTTATTLGGPGLYTVMSQAPAGGGIDIYYQDGSLKFNNGTSLVSEPLAGHWTHVAVVCNSGDVNVYYNGRQQTLASPVSANLGNSSDPLYIGRRGNNDFQHFSGELTGIRINNTALYSTAFVPNRLPTAPTGTVLLMNGYYPLVDQSTSAHSISNGGATKSLDFPKLTATGGTGTPGTGAIQAQLMTLTPSTNGTGTPGTAYPGDTITWNITSNPFGAGLDVYWWVDYDAAPASTWVQGTNNGHLVLDSNGSGSFSLTVAQSAGVQFRMYIGHSLYQGTCTHGYIGV